ncbi:pyridoxal-5'-phosphate-dependent protein [Vibrio cholerae]|uniref:DegT/DnrJ/EryC1/StrS family aminotransferase n=1 Tax=Vibrio cholerae TaxID=666 RepID=UPI0011D691E4|nr:DegT/DnrJ/EryC1/StrS family aminotransferase [Vibrio cholerae]TXY35408.1 DegT/DnrJ/EryC1/StrS family aminotransferase [Vibrio cholerae]BCN16702.1 putative aminotransferase [Vibrio cholerae]GHW86626.1 pyridoxal-5'-phosphate-dependent protein [Vibrio cholerae]
MIPLVKVGLPKRDVLMPALENILYSGIIAEGQEVYDFESKFLTTFNIEHGLAMSSGTAALHASLVLSGVIPGDEVITTSMTAEPTNLSILQAGAVPVFADVDPNSGNICPVSILEKITSKTKAILVVHYAGYPARMNEIMDIASKYGLKVIEDCAHAMGATYEGKSIGTLGDFSIFSFQAIKHMTTIDGGFLVFKDNSVLERAKKFRWFGMLKGADRTSLDISEMGYKYNMHNVAAVIGSLQLDSIEERLRKHKSNAEFFNSAFENLSHVKPAAFECNSQPTYWLYTLLAEDSDAIVANLSKVGVQASKLHRPNHLHSIFGNTALNLPNLETFYKKLVHIPVGWWVTEEQREAITNAVINEK